MGILVIYLSIINFTYSYYLRRYLENFDLTNALNYIADGTRPEEEISIYIDIDLPIFFIPGVTTNIFQTFEFADRESFKIKIGLRYGKNKRLLKAKAPERGVYKSKKIVFTSSDVLGFSKTHFEIDAEKTFTIYPNSLFINKEKNYHSSVGEKLINSKEMKKNESLTDFKKYFPGDDTRKINWKIYARTHELYVRQEDIESMPDSMNFFMLYMDLSDTSSKTKDLTIYLDRFVEIFAALVVTEISTKGSAGVILPGRKLLHFKTNNVKDFLRIASSIQLSDFINSYELNTINKLAINIIAFPSEKNLSGFANNLLAKKNIITIYFKDVFKLEEKRLKLSVLDFLYNNKSSKTKHLFVKKDQALSNKIDKTINQLKFLQEIIIERL